MGQKRRWQNGTEGAIKVAEQGQGEHKQGEHKQGEQNEENERK